MATKLAEVGLVPVILQSAPGRTSVVARYEAAATPTGQPGRGALLIHAHLDVVPAEPHEWSVHPFSGEIRDGYLWGRGAVDMKDFDAMVLALVRRWRREGRLPPRDLVLAFVADEEAGGWLGAHYLVHHHPDLFEGCTEAIGEVGGFSYTISPDLRLYLVETAEKGLDWLRLHARGRPGHGSMIHDDNAVTVLAEAVARLGRHRFPVVMTDTVRAFMQAVSDALGITLDPDQPEAAIAKLGSDSSDRRLDHPQHRQPDPAQRRLQGQRDPRHGQRYGRLPHPAGPGGCPRRAGTRGDRPRHRD